MVDGAVQDEAQSKMCGLGPYISSWAVMQPWTKLHLLRISPLGEAAEAEAEAEAAMATAATTASGLVVTATDPIRSFLSSSAASGVLTGELCALAATLSSEPAVPYCSLRAIWCATSSQGRPPLRQLLRGAEFLLSSPKPREKSDELKARLEKLREAQERREYAELVRDVAPRKEDNPEPFSSYKDQIGFGLHVVLIMFTGYLVGFAAFRALFNNSPVMNAAGGILGLVGGMLVETVLFIIRSSGKELASSSVPRSKKVQ